MDIEDSMMMYYRERVAEEIENCLYTPQDNDPVQIEQAKWFNFGLRYAVMIARHGL
jgi:hypothetical protein